VCLFATGAFARCLKSSLEGSVYPGIATELWALSNRTMLADYEGASYLIDFHATSDSHSPPRWNRSNTFDNCHHYGEPGWVLGPDARLKAWILMSG
jgi:hypothetical protein